jgi:hypothetical protein
MRHARESLGLELDGLARRTRIPVHQLEAVETGRLDALPRGVYARAIIRAYASAVGLEPNNAVAEMAPLLPEAEDALAGIARVRGFTHVPACDGSAPLQIGPSSEKGGALARLGIAGQRAKGQGQRAKGKASVSRSAALAWLRIAMRSLTGPPWVTLGIPLTLRAGGPSAPKADASARLRISPSPSKTDGREARADRGAHARAFPPPGAAGFAVAAVLDGAVLSAVGLLLVLATALAAAVPVGSVLALASPAILLLVVLISALYFLLLGGVAGATVGARLARLDVPAPAAVTATAALGRGATLAARELSIVVDLALPLLASRRPGGTPATPRSETRWEAPAPAP